MTPFLFIFELPRGRRARTVALIFAAGAVLLLALALLRHGLR